ncbi:putative heparinase superfamily protein [Rubricella aquisinus]|uniref:Putative heparinase superfamily protein n=1 Tax=Rubricella aquisinus TaxID=2028108 RepID=A0A840WLN0_9RHOB|nr:heparinase II/III family protein [Rubricella aquisinus]MBB5515441.1 putative heparinase superfamily protein [Rubricella aquisinus]
MTGLSSKLRDIDNRYHIWRAGLNARVRAIVSQPEPHVIGNAARGRQLLSGNFLFAGELVSAPGTAIWDVKAPTPAFTDALHGFEWLDDLAAIGNGDPRARSTAQAWVHAWCTRFGAGRGPGWRADLAGSRVLRWITHAPFLLRALEADASATFFAQLARQASYLSHTWEDAPAGLPRFEALAGLAYAGLSLEGAESHLKGALAGLARECASTITAEGGLPSRNPEELAQVFARLVWCARSLEETGHTAPAALGAAIDRMAPVLRNLRLMDGMLPHFHGGTRGMPGALEQALAESGNTDATRAKYAMGYCRMQAGRAVLLIDAAPLPDKSPTAHAAPLSFEMGSGRRLIVVNTGAGGMFGAAWTLAAREAEAHSGLTIAGANPAKFVPGKGGATLLTEGPRTVTAERAIDRSGFWMLCSQDGFVPAFGLTHERRLFLSPDGRDLRGEDTLSAQSTRDKGTLAAQIQSHGGTLPVICRFHLHPDVEAKLDMAGEAVSLTLLSGEVWVFRQSGGEITLEPSTYLDHRRLRPRATKQIVVKCDLTGYGARVNWVFRRTEDGGRHTRDLMMPEQPGPDHAT